jgi:hypothetical protein
VPIGLHVLLNTSPTIPVADMKCIIAVISAPEWIWCIQ